MVVRAKGPHKWRALIAGFADEANCREGSLKIEKAIAI